ncbi:MAG: NAD(P)H-dependent oxidoreductase subunit E [Anaerolineaceae bacterium]|nr:NAD(P)H-dependent oxidoreductase subunit E [Anaerolineaceae bacterium]
MSELQEKYAKEINGILAKYPAEQKRSALLPLLTLAQRETGRISDEMVEEIAEIVEISRTDVISVASFYTLFHLEEGGLYRIQICTDLPCALRGSADYLNAVCDYLAVKPGQATTDGLFTVEEVKCLAACHFAPVMQLQGRGEVRYHENQSLESTRKIIEEIRAAHQEEVTA